MAAIREHTIGELFRDLAGELRSLVKEEIELARVEFTDTAVKAAKDAAALVAGGVLLFAGAMALLACAIAAISIALPVWLSALLIGAFFSIAGVFLIAISIDYISKGRLKPNRTIASIKKTRDTLKEAGQEMPFVKERVKQEASKSETSMEKTPSELKSHGKKMEDLEQEMDATRSGMHRTINEIEDKLSPSSLAKEAEQNIRRTVSGLKAKITPPAGGRAGKIASKATSIIKKNPLPVFITGVGVSWLITKGARHKSGG